MLLRRRRSFLRPSDDNGSMLIEAVVGSFVLVVAIIGVIASMGAGMTLVGGSRQRSSASAVAQERIERVHNVPYDRVALNETPTYNYSVDHPDNKVSGSNYEVAAGESEALVIDTAQGALKHVDDPITVGQTEFVIYQYVTWVDDPNIDPGTEDYKRVLVIARWKNPLRNGTADTVVESTFIGTGTVTLPEQGPTPGPTASPPPATPPPVIEDLLLGLGAILFPAEEQQPNPNGPCPADSKGPNEPRPPFSPATLLVLSGAGAELGYVNGTSIQLRVKAADTCQIAPTTIPDNPDPNDIRATFSNCIGAPPPTPTPSGTPVATITPTPTPEPCPYTDVAQLESDVEATLTWTIPGGDIRKRIYARFLDANGKVSATYGVDVILDQTKPTTPATLTKTSCTISGSNRTLGLAWEASTDENLVGYRYYRSIGTGAYTLVGTTTALSATVTDKKTDGVRHLVRGYDKAGNESLDSNVLSVSSNSEPC